MVQRKLPSKQADGVKTERLGSLKLSSCQHSDGKNKATHDLKKRMKKSRPIKLSDIEDLTSSPVLRKTVAKPLPLHMVTPQNKCTVKATDGSPNYMKSTSSSQAKKETCQVSSHSRSYTRNLHRRGSGGSKFISGSVALTRTSSLKMVRNLTKAPSFKPTRASAKKCTRVALCADMAVQRATCSSTLKDSKFPAYLMLNPGGNESAGTSVVKVCPYTYCSLNGHYKTPLPLKCFIKAKRRSLKNQRSMNMGALSSPILQPSGYGDGTEELDAEQLRFGNRPASNEMDSDKSYMSPMMQDRCMDYFIEIYAKGKGDDAEANRGSSPTNTNRMDGSGCGGNETTPEYDADKLVSESLSESSPQSEIDFDEEMKYNENDEDFRESLVKKESSPWNFHDGDQQECFSIIDVDHTMFEVIDMKCAELQFSDSDFDNDTHSSLESDDESDSNDANSSETDANDMFDDLGISFRESNNSITVAEVIMADGAEQEVLICNEVSEIVYDDQVSSTKDALKVLVAKEEENIELNLRCIIAIPSSIEEQLEGLEAKQTVSISGFLPKEELPSGEAAGDRMKADVELLIGTQISDSSHVLSEADEDNQKVDDEQTNQHSKVNDAIDEGFPTEETADEILFYETEDYLSSSKHENTNVEDNQNIIWKDQEEAKFKVPTFMNSEQQSIPRLHKICLVECNEEAVKMELEDGGYAELDVAEPFPTKASDHKTSHKLTSKPSSRNNAKKELYNTKLEICRKRHELNNEEPRKFNPREPNFLPLIQEKDAEKVDLKHQMMDERKNAEEWMLDHALRQAVTKLAPARKRKVALLVEAFETVLPVTKCETNQRRTSTSAGFGHARPIQACN